jgi:hypothetical protein
MAIVEQWHMDVGKETKLTVKHHVPLENAAMIMGSSTYSYNTRETTMVVVPTRNSCMPYITIPEGYHALIHSQSRYVGIWGSGCHWARPWEAVAKLVTKSFVTYDMPEKGVISKDNVEVKIDISMVVAVLDDESSVYDFVYKCGPEELENMLRNFGEESVRTLARQRLYTNIYDLMESEPVEAPKEKKMALPGAESDSDSDDDEGSVQDFLDNEKRRMNAKLRPYGVELFSITVTNVGLPDNFRRMMENATSQLSENILQASKQTYDLQVIDDSEKLAQANQALQERKQEAVSANDSLLASENKTIANIQAQTKALVQKIAEQTEAECQQIKTENEFETAKIDKQTHIDLSDTEAKADAEARRIQSETNAYCETKRAEAGLRVAQLDAEALDAIANAENEASQKLTSLRELDAKMAHLAMVRKLAMNKRVTLNGTNSDNMMAQLVSAKNAARNVGLVH